jgi:hypothetical protein
MYIRARTQRALFLYFYLVPEAIDQFRAPNMPAEKLYARQIPTMIYPICFNTKGACNDYKRLFY